MSCFIKLHFLEKDSIINHKIVFRKFTIKSYYFTTVLKHQQNMLLCVIKKKKLKHLFKDIVFRFDFLNVSYAILYLSFSYIKLKTKKLFNSFVFIYYRLLSIKLKIKNLFIFNLLND